LNSIQPYRASAPEKQISIIKIVDRRPNGTLTGPVSIRCRIREQHSIKKPFVYIWSVKKDYLCLAILQENNRDLNYLFGFNEIQIH
jgi:hypothetical protein